MSRCFPFPPPGYEKKAKTDGANLLKKEKHGERKDKKEKKDKEKRENREKKDRDRNGAKNRDKKERKEKHKEKKKDKEKERGKDKDKNATSEENKISGQSENCNGEKPNKNEKERDKGKNGISNEKKQTLHLQGYSGEKPIQNSFLAKGNGDSKFVQELGRRIRDEDGGTGSQLVEKLLGVEQTNNERMDTVVVKDTGILAGGKEKKKEKIIDIRKIDAQGVKDDARSIVSAVIQNLGGMVQNRVGVPRPLEKNIERRLEGREKSKDREGEDKQRDKLKGKDRDKKDHGKDKDKEKEKKKEKKVNEKREVKNKYQDEFRDGNNDHLVTQNFRIPHVAKDGDGNTSMLENLKKRKDPEENGFLRDTNVRPNKMPRPSPHPLTENGRKLEPCQTPILFTTDGQGPANNHMVDNNELKVNGIIEAQPLPISSKKLPASKQADQVAQVSMKPPHPDSKYLGQVLSVPKMEEWSDFDDQEWLFSSEVHSTEKKPNVGLSAGVTEMPKVWAEALQMESADLCALPYVVPY